MPLFMPTDDEANFEAVDIGDEQETSSKAEKSEEGTASPTTTKTPLRDISAALAPKKAPGAKMEVLDPRNHGEGSARYTSYCVLVPNESGVRRRYSDFQWLYERLLIEKPGAMVPIIPHIRAPKPDVRFSDELTQKRSAQLQEFMRRVLDSPELIDAESLSIFIKADDHVFEASKVDKKTMAFRDSSHGMSVPDEYADGVNTKPRSPVFPKLRKLLSKVSVACAMELATTEDEAVFDGIKQYASELDIATQSMVSQAAAYVKSTKDRAKATEDLSRSYWALFQSSYPGQVGDLSTLLNVHSKHLAGIGQTVNQEANEEIVKLEEPLQDLQRDVEAVKMALHCRKEAQLMVTRRKNDIRRHIEDIRFLEERKKDNMTNENYTQSIDEMIKEMNQGILTKSSAIEAAEARLEDVSKRVMREMDRFGIVLHKKLSKAMIMFANVQVQCNSKINDSCLNLLSFHGEQQRVDSLV